MALSPIAFIAPNFRDFSTWWLKSYEPSTTTPKTMALDSAGVVTVAKLELNADGFLESAGGALVIPYIDGAYDAWLFPTEAEADANDTVNAERVADDVIAPLNAAGMSEVLISEVSQSYDFDTIADVVASTIVFPIGKQITVADYATGNNSGVLFFRVVSGGTGTADGGKFIDLPITSLQLEQNLKLAPCIKSYGIVGDWDHDTQTGTNNAAQFVNLSAYASSFTVPIGSFHTTSLPIFKADQSVIGVGRGSEIVLGGSAVAVMALRCIISKVAFICADNHTANAIEIGDTVDLSGGRSVVDNVWIENSGGDGIRVIDGNLGTLRDIWAVGNAGSGVIFTDDTPDNNAWNMEGFNDLRSNGLFGLLIQFDALEETNSSNSHNITVNAQANTLEGVKVESRNNQLSIYGENNAKDGSGENIQLSSTSRGNYIISRTSDVLDEGLGNIVLKRLTTFEMVFSSQPAFNRDGWKLHDTGFGGDLTFEHQSSNNYEMLMKNSSTSQTITYKNIVDLANPDVDYPVENFNEQKHAYTGRYTSALSGANSIIDTWGGFTSYTPPSNATRNSMLADGSMKNGAGVYGSYSDRTLKNSIEYLDESAKVGQAADIRALKFAKFKMNDDPNNRVMLGVIAQDVQETSPGLVDINPVIKSVEQVKTGVNDKGEDVFETIEHMEDKLGVKDSIMFKKAIIALQVAFDRIDELEARLVKLGG